MLLNYQKSFHSSLLVNYRPISLLPTISKVFERVIHDELYEYFNLFNLLAEQRTVWFLKTTLHRIRGCKINRSC